MDASRPTGDRRQETDDREWQTRLRVRLSVTLLDWFYNRGGIKPLSATVGQVGPSALGVGIERRVIGFHPRS